MTTANNDPRNRRFASMVNAVLRRLSREKADFVADNSIGNVPGWFEEILVSAYGKDKAKAILDIQAKEPPIDLTVKGDAEEWAQRLGGIALPTGSVRLAGIDGALTALPGFAEGEWWVQDTAASPGQAVRRYQGQTCCRPLRRTGRQDRTTGLCRCKCHCARPFRQSPEATAFQSRTFAAVGRDGGGRSLCLYSGRALRRDPARCALFVYRHRAAPSGRALDQDARGCAPAEEGRREQRSFVAVAFRSRQGCARKLPKDEQSGSELDARQVFDRLAGTWTYWGWKGGYFSSEEDARAFRDELAYMLATQRVAPNSPQWFNTGLHWAYGIDGPGQGHFYVDPFTGKLTKSKSAYEHPQPHACFIQSVEDDLVNEGGIMDLWVREARLFKYGSGTGSNFSICAAKAKSSPAAAARPA